MKKFTIVLSPGKIFTKAPTKIILEKLISLGSMKLTDSYDATYDCNNGIVTITIDDSKVDFDACKSATENLCKDESQFK